MGTNRGVLAGVAIVMVVLAGCGGSGGANGGDADAGSTTAAETTVVQNDTTTTEPTEAADPADGDSSAGTPVASAGCESGATAAAAPTPTVEQRLDRQSGGVDRFALITTPSAIADGEPLPLVFDFHGLAEGAEVHARMTAYSALAEQEGFIAVFPHGTGDLARWAAGPDGTIEANNPDTTFVTELLDQLEATHCIDVSRIYATGISNGGMMTSAVACRLGDRIAAAAPIAGVAYYDDCNDITVPIYTVHGTQDPILLFNGGVGDLQSVLAGTGNPTATTVVADLEGPGYPTFAAEWAAHNGCEATPVDTRIDTEIVERRWTCPTGADVVMMIVEGGGHGWPGSEFSKTLADRIGYTTDQIDATADGWAFLSQFRRTAS